MKKTWITPVCEITRFDLNEEILAGSLMSLNEERDGLELDFGSLT